MAYKGALFRGVHAFLGLGFQGPLGVWTCAQFGNCVVIEGVLCLQQKKQQHIGIKIVKSKKRSAVNGSEFSFKFFDSTENENYMY